MRVLGIGDKHLPFTHPKYLSFIKKIQKRFNTNATVDLGDVYEHNSISYHESDPSGHSAGDELILAERAVRPWKKAFPNQKVCYGNHDKLPYRQAQSNGIPRHMIRELNDIYNTPKWKWADEHIIDDVMYHHGKGAGKNAALDTAMKERMSVVQGHAHSWGGVQYTSSTKDMLFGMNVGCGIDIRRYCFAYGKKFSVRPTLGCGVVLEGKEAIFIPMPL
jgi:predicted phosphodiesterase